MSAPKTAERDDVKTPYYEIDEEKLDDEIALLQSALKRCWGEKGIYACSVKTNSLPWLLNHFRKKGAGDRKSVV